MNKIFWYVFLIIVIRQVGPLKAQEIRESLPLQFGLVEGLDTLGLNTGDILFFQSTKFEGIMIQWGTLSPYTHTAMVIKEEDGSLWLTHATDNYYERAGIPVRDEIQARNGVILTKLEDSFLSVNEGKTGFYKRIWLRKLDDSKKSRPSREEVLGYYKTHKHLPFETSRFRFILSSFDLRICGKDLLSLKDDEAVMCSEYIYTLLREVNFPVNKNQASNEYTPKDINRMIDPYYIEPLVYRFKDGMYRLK